MNIAQIKQIALVDFLRAIGIHPVKETPFSAWYHAPYREDRSPSFKVNKNRNQWFDFGTAQNGDIIDLGMLVYRTRDISRILKLIERATPFVPIRTRNYLPLPTEPSAVFQNLKTGSLSSLPLKSYLITRGINLDVAERECREVQYTCRGKTYFAIAFPNVAGGYEIRNPYYKGCIAPKDISFSTPASYSEGVCVFEGFMDYLSYLTMQEQGRLPAPCDNPALLVLNSVNNLHRALPKLKAYREIYCYLDNDDAGRRVVDMLREIKPGHVHDMTEAYPLYKDLNDILLGKKKMP